MNFNGQGPRNEGPRTGRGMGNCENTQETTVSTPETNSNASESDYGLGRGGQPRGGGRGPGFGGRRRSNR